MKIFQTEGFILKKNLINLIFYKYYRIAEKIGSDNPKEYSLGLISGIFMLILFIISLELNGHFDLINSNLIFYIFVIILVLLYTILRIVYKDEKKVEKIILYYEETINLKVNNSTDIILGIITIAIPFLPVFYFN